MAKKRVSRKYLADYTIAMAKQSLEMEAERHRSLLGTSSRILTSISIISLGVATLAPSIIGSADHLHLPMVIAVGSIVAALLLASFLLALLAQFRFRYNALPSPETIYDHTIKAEDTYRNYGKVADQYCRSLNSVYTSLWERNEKIYRYITASTITLIVAVSVLVVIVLALFLWTIVQ